MSSTLQPRISTVGRNRKFSIDENEISQSIYKTDKVNLYLGDSLNHYKDWETPDVIISDGAYGILGFEGDTSDHLGLPEWYEPHIRDWSKYSTPQTTLWFWNSEIGWASVHPILEKYGWRYVNCNIWNKGKGHIAGNVNTKKIRRFPVVSEVCVQYVFQAKIGDLSLQEWLISEWSRTGLPRRKANDACGVKDVATRKYLDKGHLWYFPPSEMFERMSLYANEFGNPEGKPYFSIDGINPGTKSEWEKMRTKFFCPHGFTNIWDRNSLRGKERIKVPSSSNKSAHLNQKPLDLMKLIIESSSSESDVIWEPFGGLFSGSLASFLCNRRSFGGEIDPTYYQLGVNRFKELSTLE
jgi:hypothetical protein